MRNILLACASLWICSLCSGQSLSVQQQYNSDGLANNGALVQPGRLVLQYHLDAKPQIVQYNEPLAAVIYSSDLSPSSTVPQQLQPVFYSSDLSPSSSVPQQLQPVLAYEQSHSHHQHHHHEQHHHSHHEHHRSNDLFPYQPLQSYYTYNPPRNQYTYESQPPQHFNQFVDSQHGFFGHHHQQQSLFSSYSFY